MKTRIGQRIWIENPTDEIKAWCKENLVVANPEYAKKQRMGFWVGNIPRELWLYEVWAGTTYVIPFGCLRSLLPLLQGTEVETLFDTPQRVNYSGDVPLYDYQEVAVKAMLAAHYGILQSPAGSGKTQMGIALMVKLGVRTLWLTHTLDLLEQSKARASMYIPPGLIGTISGGKVEIGNGVTFATVQTLSRLDLDAYRNLWDCCIVDECHRVAGTPTAVTQFNHVLNSLSARHKYGLSATVHRADGLIQATYSLLGQVAYAVPDNAVQGKVMRVSIRQVNTGTSLHPACQNSDGTVNYGRMIEYLTESPARNRLILNDLAASSNHYNLILSGRVKHLKTLISGLPAALREQAVMIDGSMTSKSGKARREQALDDMRTGRKHYLFATFTLAKEGLDIPRLDRLFMVTPQKDYAVIVQSIGRIARTFPGKESPVVYDYVDSIRSLQKAYRQRCTTYRKEGCEFL